MVRVPQGPRPARGFAVVVGATWLVQPQGVDTTPLLMLALGASRAGSWRPRRLPRRRPLRAVGAWSRRIAVAMVVTGLLGLVAAIGACCSASARSTSAWTTVRCAAVHRATRVHRLLPGDQVAARPRSSSATGSAATCERPDRCAARRPREDRARAGADRPDWWNRLGEVEGEWGSRAADAAFREALEYNPWSIRAMDGRYRLAVRAHEHRDRRLGCARGSVPVSRPRCPAGVGLPSGWATG